MVNRRVGTKTKSRTAKRAARARVKQSVRRSKPSDATQAARIAKMVRALELVAKKGAKNKLPGATSDHSFLYDSDGLPR